MRISEINIKGLYGTYTYRISNLLSRNLLILTGYNGMGKTTILNIVKNIADSNLWFFYELDFEDIKVSFEGGLTLSMSSSNAVQKMMFGNKELQDENINPEKRLTYEWYRDKKLLSSVTVDRHNFYKAFTVVCKADFVAEGGDWVDLMLPKMKEIVAYICKRQNVISFEMVQASIRAFMIPAQRVKQIHLVSDDEDRYPFPNNEMEEIDTIDVVAESFGRMLEQKRIEFLSNIQNSKNQLMDRLLDADTQILNEEEYSSMALDVQANIDDLGQFGITYEKIRPYSVNNARLLSAYLLELRDTLSRYKGLLTDLNLFASILREKHFLHKTISFSPSYGFKAFNEQGISIKPSLLSSGEQNIIILLYRMIFEVNSGDILLIDEPEISMHVVWLKEFIKDVQKISSYKKGIQILIATHSPQIVRGATENCYDLEMNNYGK